MLGGAEVYEAALPVATGETLAKRGRGIATGRRGIGGCCARREGIDDLRVRDAQSAHAACLYRVRALLPRADDDRTRGDFDDERTLRRR
ncbi:Uncharacterised protein [Burkholderia oklahomensis]|nr:hypothetical protein BG90_3950 [Burkholderia oklahomensis C6786]AOI49979.1 hypothetical protein WI23_30250 [Burkholderia oklahomensis C6786]KUY53103.1 hypothetical protein WI23_23200 [Burkholderia oklahomensis C6786]SUY28510.1 Uncharacterised protein [Burkholderia oklahomensis]